MKAPIGIGPGRGLVGQLVASADIGLDVAEARLDPRQWPALLIDDPARDGARTREPGVERLPLALVLREDVRPAVFLEPAPFRADLTAPPR